MSYIRWYKALASSVFFSTKLPYPSRWWSYSQVTIRRQSPSDDADIAGDCAATWRVAQDVLHRGRRTRPVDSDNKFHTFIWLPGSAIFVNRLLDIRQSIASICNVWMDPSCTLRTDSTDHVCTDPSSQLLPRCKKCYHLPVAWHITCVAVVIVHRCLCTCADACGELSFTQCHSPAEFWVTSEPSWGRGVQLSYPRSAARTQTVDFWDGAVLSGPGSTTATHCCSAQSSTSYKRHKTTSFVSSVSVSSANALKPDQCWSLYTGCRYNTASSIIQYENSSLSRLKPCPHWRL